jgi:UDP-N-acetylglucosamine 3-dehydrogenase
MSTGVIDEFVSSIINKEPPLISGEDGLAALKIVFAMMESAEEKQIKK